MNLVDSIVHLMTSVRHSELGTNHLTSIRPHYLRKLKQNWNPRSFRIIVLHQQIEDDSINQSLILHFVQMALHTNICQCQRSKETQI